MKYQIQIHFENKGFHTFDVEVSKIEEIIDLLNELKKDLSKSWTIIKSALPAIINMDKVIAITTHLIENETNITNT